MTASPDFDITSVLRKIYIKPIQNIVIIDDDYKALWDMQKITEEFQVPQKTVESEETVKVSVSAHEEDALLAEPANSSIEVVDTSNQEITSETTMDIANKIINSCKDNFILHVDNRPNISDKIIEKADFLILDYYLTKDENPEHSISILKKYIGREKFSPIIIHSSLEYNIILDKLVSTIENTTTKHEENYIWGEGFFIIILNKITDTQNSIYDFFDTIIEKMGKQSPTPLFILAQSCIKNISQQSIKISNSIFSDSATRAGILYHILSQSIDTKDKKQKSKLCCKDLIQRIFEDLGVGVFSNLESDIEEFISTLTPQQIKGKETLQQVKYKEILQHSKHVEQSTHEDLEIILKLNAHLCSHEHNLDYITTGTIFKSNNNDYYLCATPSCDSIPGRVKVKEKGSKIACQRAKFNGGNHFGCILLEEVEEAKIVKTLKNAENGRHIFIHEGDYIKAFRALDDNNQPFLHTFYAQNGGYINPSTQKIELMYPTFCETQKNLILKTEIMTIIGQLRHLYASNLLQRVGIHNFRIGVDFRKKPQS